MRASLQTLPPHRKCRWLRKLMWIMIIVMLAPFALTLAYRHVDPPASMLMAIRKAGGQNIDFRWRPIDQISNHLINAVATAEDARLCSHNGVDWDVLGGLVKDALDDDAEPARGGSTITMQTAKNLYLWPQRSYFRKSLEIPISLWIDLIWSKRRTMEIYLNIAEWGPGIFGAEAAARHHFKRPAVNLTRQQALLLAASLPNPMLYNPGKPGPKLHRRTRRLSKRTSRDPAYLNCLKP